MDWGGPTIILAIIAISTFGWIATSWIRARHGYPVEGEWGGTSVKQDPAVERTMALLTSENEALHGKIVRLEDRISVLERIATDKPMRLADEIENLR